MNKWLKWVTGIGAGTVVTAIVILSAPVHIQANDSNLISEQKQKVTDGTEFSRQHFRSGSIDQRVNVLTINTRDQYTEIGLKVPLPLTRLETVSSQALVTHSLGRRTIGVMNASFYETAGTYRTLPANLVLQEGMLIRQGRQSTDDSGYNFARQAFGITQDGKGVIDTYDLNTTLHINGQPFEISGIDPNGRQLNQALLFTPRYLLDAPGHSYSKYSTEMVLTNLSVDPSRPLPLNEEVTGTVSEIHAFGEENNTLIPDDGIVLTANGGEWSDRLDGVNPGDDVTFTVTVNNHWEQKQSVIGGGPYLVKDGKRHITMDAGASQARTRAPRTAVGISSSGDEIFYVTVDGRQNGYSNGMTITELADYMIRLGADRAMNLDGGGSTAIAHQKPGYWHPDLTNRPSESVERRVSTTLQVFDTSPLRQGNLPMEVLSEMTTPEAFRVGTVQADASVRSTAGTNLPKYRGNNGIELSYDFSGSDGNTAAAYLNFKTAAKVQENVDRFGFWVYAEENNHWLRGRIADFNGNKYPVDFTEPGGLSWRGWKYVEAKIPATAQGPVTLDQIYVVEPSGDNHTSGRIIISGLEAIYDGSYQVQRFFDVPTNHWALHSIVNLSEKGVIGGHADGSFKPSGNITREQAAAMIRRDLDLLYTSGSYEFDDVDVNRPLYTDIAAVADAGIMRGINGNFNPADPLTRAELATVLVRAYNLTGETDEEFSDVPESHWASGNVEILLANDLTGGYPDGTFKPNNPVTRAEFSVFMDRIK